MQEPTNQEWNDEQDNFQKISDLIEELKNQSDNAYFKRFYAVVQKLFIALTAIYILGDQLDKSIVSLAMSNIIEMGRAYVKLYEDEQKSRLN